MNQFKYVLQLRIIVAHARVVILRYRVQEPTKLIQILLKCVLQSGLVLLCRVFEYTKYVPVLYVKLCAE